MTSEDKGKAALFAGLVIIGVGALFASSNRQDAIKEYPDIQPPEPNGYDKFICTKKDTILPIEFGSCGNNVKLIQKYFNANGASLTVDGKFGPKTENASIQFLGTPKITQSTINKYLKV